MLLFVDLVLLGGIAWMFVKRHTTSLRGRK